jgi:serine/threonine-protein kinase HipA
MTTDRAQVFYEDLKAGLLRRTNVGGFEFVYDSSYLQRTEALPISHALPLRPEPYQSPGLFPFFEGLLPEGWLLELITTKLKIDPKDRWGLLLATGADTVGAVTVRPIEDMKK